MLALLDKLAVAEKGKNVLVMLPQRDENVLFSTRNIPSAKVQHVASINVVEMLKHDCLIMPEKTVRWIELVFGEGLSAEEASHRIAEDMADVEDTEAEAEAETTAEIEAEQSGAREDADEASETGETGETNAADTAGTGEEAGAESENE